MKQPMTTLAEPDPVEITKEQLIADAMSSKLFKDAVGEAQILLAYASSKSHKYQKYIDARMLEVLITARDQVNQNKPFTAEQEAIFWVNYQKLLSIVEPVTANSIRMTASKAARRSINRHIFFTVSVLIVLLIFQVYWVIGTQLIDQVQKLLLLKEQTSVLANVSSTEISTAETPVKITEPESLKSKLAMNSRILLDWGHPWYWMVDDRDPRIFSVENNAKYAPLVKDIDRQIDKIETEKQKSILAQLVATQNQQDAAGRTNLDDMIKLYELKSTLDSLLMSAEAKEADLQKQRTDQENHQSVIEKDLAKVDEDLAAIREQAGNLIGQKTTLTNRLAYLDNEILNLQEQLAQLSVEETSPPAPVGNEIVDNAVATSLPVPTPGVGTDTPENEINTAVPSAVPTSIAYADIQSQIADKEKTRRDINDQIDQVDKQLNDNTARNQSLETDRTRLQNERDAITQQLMEYTVTDQEKQPLAELLQKPVLEINKDQIQTQIEIMLGKHTTLAPQLAIVVAVRQLIEGQIESTNLQIKSLPDVVVPPGVDIKVNDQYDSEKAQLTKEKERLVVLAEADSRLEAVIEDAGPALLAGKFVLDILQNYLLPLLYGLLGAGTYALRTLSKEIELESYSERRAIQHTFRIALGALAGIMVGWFSFLIPNEGNSFIGSVSPLAIAFLVGYNIELFFRLMDRLIDPIINRVPQKEEQADMESR